MGKSGLTLSLLALSVATIDPAVAAEKKKPAVPAATGAGLTPPPKTAEPADKSRGVDDDSYVLYKLAPKNSIFSFDYGPPTSPALNLLGLSSDNTSTSTSLTKFVLAAPAVFGKEGDKSIALDLAPVAFLVPESDQSFSRYAQRANHFYRLGYRTRFNVAAKNGVDNSDPSKAAPSGVAIGLTASLLDSSDPLAVGRDKLGRPYIQHCFERYTPIVMGILEGTRSFSPADTEANQATHDLARAKDYLAKGNRAAALNSAERWLPGLSASEDTPIKTGPKHATSDKFPKVQALLQNPELAQRLGPDIAQQLKDALEELRGDQPDSQDRPPKTPTDAQPAPGSLSDKDLGALIDTRLAYWDARREKLNSDAGDTIPKAADEQISAALHGSGVKAAFAACADRANALAHFGADLDVGVGQLWKGRDGALDHLGSNGQALWVAFRLPLSRVKFADFDNQDVAGPIDPDVGPKQAFMFVGSGRFGLREEVATGDTTTPKVTADTTSAWLGFEYLRSNFRAIAQYGWVRTDPTNAANSQFARSGDRYLVGTQWNLGADESGVWVGLNYGNGYGNAAAFKANTALVTLSYSPPKAPDLTPRK